MGTHNEAMGGATPDGSATEARVRVWVAWDPGSESNSGGDDSPPPPAVARGFGRQLQQAWPREAGGGEKLAWDEQTKMLMLHKKQCTI